MIHQINHKKPHQPASEPEESPGKASILSKAAVVALSVFFLSVILFVILVIIIVRFASK